MFNSMTGFGKAEDNFKERKYTIEIRSINSRFCEISLKYPKYLYSKEFELKEAIRKNISRGKLNVNINIENGDEKEVSLTLNDASVKEYIVLLKSLRKKINSKEKIRLDHVLHFTEFMMKDTESEISESEFAFLLKLLDKALDDLRVMKRKEGKYLENDVLNRIDFIENENNEIIGLGRANIDIEKQKFHEKLASLVIDKNIIDDKRLELEIAIMLEKMDITEECVRLLSHLKFFKESVNSNENAGRKLNFLLQEMNREINTIASKAMDANISQKVSVLKEELEKIREQIQNIE
jgi:uncharacterized protein (TIGR00255 family)